MHGKRFAQDSIGKIREASLAERMNATFRKSKIDGLGEIERDSVGISEVSCMLANAHMWAIHNVPGLNS